MNITIIAGDQTAEGPGTLGSAAQLSQAASELGWSVTIGTMPVATQGSARLQVIEKAAESDVVIPLVSGLRAHSSSLEFLTSGHRRLPQLLLRIKECSMIFWPALA